jgi:hypothetical protein
MKKAAIPALVVVILLAFGIILAVIVISWGMNKAMEMVNGKCWADMDTAMSQVKSDFGNPSSLPKTKKIVMGDCVGGVVAFNKNMPSEMQSFSPLVDQYCTKSDYYNSYILILPWKTLKADSQKDKSWWDAITEKVSWRYWADAAYSVYQTARFIKPNCIGLEGEFSQTAFMPDALKNGPKNLNEQNIALCYSLSTTPSTNKLGYAYNLNFVNALSKTTDECVIKS